MTSKSIEISEDTYNKLLEIVNRFQKELKREISIDDAIRFILKRKITDLAGSWNISDDEFEEIKNSLDKGWIKWKTSV